MNPRWLAVPLMMIYSSMAVLYGLDGDWRRCLYWIAADVICYVVTF